MCVFVQVRSEGFKTVQGKATGATNEKILAQALFPLANI